LKSTFNSNSSLAKILARPEVSYCDLPERDAALSSDVIQQVEIEIKYSGYVDRQVLEVARFKNLENKSIPEQFDYATVPSLRLEARQKLTKIRPQTIGQAARISGVSPADISILLVWLKRGGKDSSGNASHPEDGCKNCSSDEAED
jgi:tRNA uridine 5-carboxymethylaminomethyl modification enzyme